MIMMLSSGGTSLVCACSRQQRHSYIRRLSSSNNTKSSDKNDASTIVDQMKSFSIGSLAGMLGSLAGMGGGFVMIPMMTASRGLRLTQHQAHGTSLFAVGSTGLFGALAYGIKTGEEGEDDDIVNNSTDSKMPQQQGLVELDIALALTATAMVTARFGAIASSKMSERSLKRALGAFMLFIAPLVPGKKYLDDWLEGNDKVSSDKQVQTQIIDTSVAQQPSNLERLLPASFIGTFSGFLSGMFGVGGGAIVVPSLVLSTDMSHHAALGTSLCAMVLPAMVGVLTHANKGNVAWRVAPSLALGSAVGAYIGGKEIGLHLEEDVLRGGFGVLMLVLGARTWRTA
mmetsp:Transcript_21717/g.36955  ORF Transcript_21717/g.36955 Transcript_21717/m.36955 type:complete len:342 (-) Transcript_21717:1099-2124(-)